MAWQPKKHNKLIIDRQDKLIIAERLFESYPNNQYCVFTIKTTALWKINRDLLLTLLIFN